MRKQYKATPWSEGPELGHSHIWQSCLMGQSPNSTLLRVDTGLVGYQACCQRFGFCELIGQFGLAWQSAQGGTREHCRLLQRQNYNLTSSGKKPWKCCFFHPLKGLGSFNPLQALFCPYSNCYPCFKCQRTEILLLIKSIGTHFPLCEGARKTKQ